MSKHTPVVHTDEPQAPSGSTDAAVVQPLSEEELERIRSLHVEWKAKDGKGDWNGPTCSMCLNRWPCPMLSVLATLDHWRQRAFDAEASVQVLARENAGLGRGIDAERTLRQAAEQELSDSREMLDGLSEELTAAHAALAEERQARERATRWADAWRFAAVLYRGKVTTQREKIEYQRDALQRLEGANTQRKGELRKARAALAACEARLAEAQANERKRVIVALIRLSDSLHDYPSPTRRAAMALVTNLLAAFCANEGIGQQYAALVREARTLMIPPMAQPAPVEDDAEVSAWLEFGRQQAADSLSRRQHELDAPPAQPAARAEEGE